MISSSDNVEKIQNNELNNIRISNTNYNVNGIQKSLREFFKPQAFFSLMWKVAY
jgi:hypothetical protein